jgi:hypothetical protein
MLTVSVTAFSQSKNFKSKKTDNEVRCANMSASFDNIRVKELKGRAESMSDQPFVFQIYKIKENEFEKAPYNLIDGKSPIKSFETNAEGKFRVKNFPEGYYVLKLGTSDGGWNCAWIAVQVSRKNKDRKIEVGLDIGI